MPAPNHTRNIVRLLIREGAFLLLAKFLKGGFYFLPGGGIEFNEPMHQAAIRELHEEIGIEEKAVKSLSPVGILENSFLDQGNPIHELNLVCLCQIEGFSASLPVISQESHLAFEWIEIAILKEIDLRPEALKDLIPVFCDDTLTKTPFYFSAMHD